MADEKDRTLASATKGTPCKKCMAQGDGHFCHHHVQQKTEGISGVILASTETTPAVSPAAMEKVQTGAHATDDEPTITATVPTTPKFRKSAPAPLTLEQLTLQPTRLRPRDFVKLATLGKGDVGRVFLVTARRSKWRSSSDDQSDSQTAMLTTPDVLRNIQRAKESSSGGGGHVNPGEVPIPTELYAMKVVNKADVIRRGKVKRVMLERNILATTNHPFIVTMYYAMQTKHRLYFFLQYCPGGEFFRMLRRQPNKRIPESYARFYASEILLAIEYLHLLGFIYRDLKPENILVHMSGHLMLADFDLARFQTGFGGKDGQATESPGIERRDQRKAQSSSRSARRSRDRRTRSRGGGVSSSGRANPLACCCGGGGANVLDAPGVDTETQLNPANAADRAMSFVGTVEYIAPEVIKNNGYAGSVDWWTFGILLYEMIFATTPFKGVDNDDTFANIYLGDFAFPEAIPTTDECKDLLELLLAKNMDERLSSPNQIRSHPFFDGVNWALLRNQQPPIIPDITHPLDTRNFRSFAKEQHAESDEEFLKRGSGVVPLRVQSDGEDDADKMDEEEEEEEDVIVVTPSNSTTANASSFHGFDWVSPRVEDPHWDDENRSARSPTKASIDPNMLKSRITCDTPKQTDQ